MMDKTLKRSGIILLASAVLAVVANSVHPRKIPWVQDWANQVESMAAERSVRIVPFSVAVEKFNGGAVFVDARSSREFGQGHIPGARSLPFGEFGERFDLIAEWIDSDVELVLYCTNRRCDDALLLAVELKAMGCRDPLLFVDGFEIWEKNGGAVEVGP